MFRIRNIEYYKSYADFKALPNTPFPEFAFIGRSNVGKSSLLNNLANKTIAQTSSTPGKTKLINYFLVNKNIFFVDLPGYGYAKVPKSMQKNWASMIEGYLEDREQLKAVFFLLDIRRMPNEHDMIINNWLKKCSNLKVFYILTKCDKLTKSEQNNQKLKIALELFVDVADFFFYSVPKKLGKQEVFKSITGFLPSIENKPDQNDNLDKNADENTDENDIDNEDER